MLHYIAASNQTLQDHDLKGDVENYCRWLEDLRELLRTILNTRSRIEEARKAQALIVRAQAQFHVRQCTCTMQASRDMFATLMISLH